MLFYNAILSSKESYEFNRQFHWVTTDIFEALTRTFKYSNLNFKNKYLWC